MLFSNTNYVYVYTNIIKDEIVRHTTAPLLALLPLKLDRRYGNISHTLNPRNYKSIHRNEINSISIQLANAKG